MPYLDMSVFPTTPAGGPPQYPAIATTQDETQRRMAEYQQMMQQYTAQQGGGSVSISGPSAPIQLASSASARPTASTDPNSAAYQDMINRLTKAYQNPLGNSSGNPFSTETNQLMSYLNQAQAAGVDPSIISQYVNQAIGQPQESIGNDIPRGLGDSQIIKDVTGSLDELNPLIKNALALPLEKYNQTQATNASIADQQAQRTAMQQKLLGQIPGLQKQLGDQLLTQEQQAYTTMAPQIENRLNALGLLQSGALPQAQAYYQGQLENSRQNELAQFGLNAQQNLSLNFPLQGLASDISQQQQNVQQGFQLDLANINRNFQLSDIANQQAFQEQLMQQQIAAAQAAQHQQGNSALIGSLIGAGGAIAGSAIGGPAGGALLGNLGSQLYTQYGSQPQPYIGSQNFGVPMTGTVNNGQVGGWIQQ